MKKRILVIGKVHNVGYRPFLLGIAESLPIKGFYADNIFVDDREAVEILVDGDSDKVEGFIKLVKSKKPENAVVDDIRVYDYDGNVMEKEAYYRYLTATQLSTIASYGRYMLSKMDIMLEKQDETVGEIRELRDDLKAYMNERFKRIEDEIRKIKEKLGLA